MTSKFIYIQFLKKCSCCKKTVVIKEVRGLAEINHVEWELDTPPGTQGVWYSNEGWSDYDKIEDHPCAKNKKYAGKFS